MAAFASATQFAYWAAHSGAASFAAAYLLSRGLPSGTVGLLMALSGLFSCLTQPVFADILDRSKRVTLAGALLLLSLLSCACFAVQIAFDLPLLAAGVCYAAGVYCSDVMSPLVNALSVSCQTAGYAVNYGAARGIGAAATALSVLVLGHVMESFGGMWVQRCLSQRWRPCR